MELDLSKDDVCPRGYIRYPGGWRRGNLNFTMLSWTDIFNWSMIYIYNSGVYSTLNEDIWKSVIVIAWMNVHIEIEHKGHIDIIREYRIKLECTYIYTHVDTLLQLIPAKHINRDRQRCLLSLVVSPQTIKLLPEQCTNPYWQCNIKENQRVKTNVPRNYTMKMHGIGIYSSQEKFSFFAHIPGHSRFYLTHTVYKWDSVDSYLVNLLCFVSYAFFCQMRKLFPCVDESCGKLAI